MDMKTTNVLCTLLLALSTSIGACASDSQEALEDGSADNDLVTSDRQTQLNVLRARVEKDFRNVRGYKLVFVVTQREDNGSKAFIRAHIMKRDARGRDAELSDADLKGSVYRDEIAEGVFDGPNVIAALEKKGTTWGVAKSGANEAYVVGPTDVAWTDWDQRFGLPRSWIF